MARMRQEGRLFKMGGVEITENGYSKADWVDTISVAIGQERHSPLEQLGDLIGG